MDDVSVSVEDVNGVSVDHAHVSVDVVSMNVVSVDAMSVDAVSVDVESVDHASTAAELVDEADHSSVDVVEEDTSVQLSVEEDGSEEEKAQALSVVEVGEADAEMWVAGEDEENEDTELSGLPDTVIQSTLAAVEDEASCAEALLGCSSLLSVPEADSVAEEVPESEDVVESEVWLLLLVLSCWPLWSELPSRSWSRS